LSFSLSFSLSLSLSLSLSVSLALCLSVPHSFCFYLCLSLSRKRERERQRERKRERDRDRERERGDRERERDRREREREKESERNQFQIAEVDDGSDEEDAADESASSEPRVLCQAFQGVTPQGVTPRCQWCVCTRKAACTSKWQEQQRGWALLWRMICNLVHPISLGHPAGFVGNLHRVGFVSFH